MPETKKTVIAGIWETQDSFYAVDFDGFMTFKERISRKSNRY